METGVGTGMETGMGTDLRTGGGLGVCVPVLCISGQLWLSW